MTPTISRARLAELVHTLARRQHAARAARPVPTSGIVARFTLKDIPDPIRSEARQRARALNPFPDGDLAASGLHFLDLPDRAVTDLLPDAEREGRPEDGRTPERLALARDWLRRRGTAQAGGAQ